jgi:glycosyltransferase involved in cell wall biosynthesis
VKVLNVNHLLDPETGGGTAERTFQLSRFLAKAGASCTVAALDIGITRARIAALEGVRVIALPCLNHRYFLPRVSLSALDSIVKDADIVHLSGHWTVLNALVYRSCRQQGKPYVFCPAGALRPFGRSIALKRLYDASFGREIARSAAACVAITDEERADFTAYGVSPGRVNVIPNGIDPKQYDCPDMQELEVRFRERFGLGHSPYILFLGRLNEIKGPDLLLQAFSSVANRFPDMHLVFAGPDGGMLQPLKAIAEKCSLAERVHFTGYLGGEDKTVALRAATMLAIPSRREAMSIVVLEAGTCGTPVLFTNACGLDEMARAKAGTMVQVSAQAVADGLSAMLSDEAVLRDSADRLATLVWKDYLWEIQAHRYMALYKRTLAGAVL